MQEIHTNIENLPSNTVNNRTERGEVALSVSIDKILAGRSLVLSKLSQAAELIKEAEFASTGVGGGVVNDWDNKSYYSSLFEMTPEKIIEHVKKVNDRFIWADLMKKSGMLSLMDDQARTEWGNNLERGEYPEVTFDNIQASFKQLNNEKNAVFERGVINLFKSLSWDYKTNNPCQFGAKIIINHFVNYDAKWGFSRSYNCTNKLDDLERILKILDGELATDHRNAVSHRIGDHVSINPSQAQVFDDEYFSIRYFKKCTAHLTFKRADLVEKLNDILAKHYPSALPPRV